MSLLNLQQLPVTPKHAVKLFHFLLRNDVVVIAADEQHCYRPGDTFEVSHVVFVEEGETEAILDLLFEKVEQEGDEGLRKAAFPVDHPPDHLLQRPDGTIEDQLVDNFVVFGSKQNGSDRTHTPSPHRQPLHFEVFICLPQNCLSV